MKKTVVLFIAFVFVVAAVHAADFAPTVMKLSAAATIQYDFDGKPIEIPLTVTGKQGTLYFVINTKDQADKIAMIQNGYLGWHYVNKIDTCVYVSPPMNIDIGSNVIDWDGKDNNQKMVPSGEYTYYMWAFDHVNARIPASRKIAFNGTKGVQIEPYDESGQPRVKPVLYPITYLTGKKDVDLPVQLTAKKWVLGGDPADDTLVESTYYMSGNQSGYIALQPDNQKNFFLMTAFNYPTPGVYKVRKYEWVPNGEAIQDTEWGDGGEYQYNCELAWPHWESGVITDREGMLYMTNQDISGVGTESELIYVDMETGEEIRRVDLAEWWVDLNDGLAGGQNCGGPTTIVYQNGHIFTSSHTSCIRQMLDPFQEDDDEIVKWVNGNGDYIGDHNFETDSARPWVCNDYNVAPFMYTTSADANDFSVHNANKLGAVTCGLVAPDGTGISYIAFAGETAAGGKSGQMFLDSGSAYDGMYCDNAITDVAEDKAGVWYISNDSIKGIITSAPVAVSEGAVAFSVAQNSPNPFNPTTTIGFSIPEAGNVSIDVFNVAGQKVGTIANEFMSAGSHSVSWDASGYSAGVYFYTVKSGDFSRTVKMTLLK